MVHAARPGDRRDSMGNSGNRARIFCRKLHAELVAIDGVYQTADDMPSERHRRADPAPGSMAT
jgi:septum formation inhibitor MinC